MEPKEAEGIGERGDTAGKLDVLRTIMLERRYQDFYRAMQVISLDLSGPEGKLRDRRAYIHEKILLPFVAEHVIGRRLHGADLVESWEILFRKDMSGKSWEGVVLDSFEKDEDAFAATIKLIQENIDKFIREKK